MANKIKFGLKNVHYAIATETFTTAWATTYATPAAWLGAVSISLDAQGDNTKFYADDGVYAVIGNNQGYEGDFESALIPEAVETGILNRTKVTTDNVIIESADDSNNVTYFALLFEFTGDDSGKRYVLYRCSLSRPTIAGQTKGESVDVQTESVTITATPRLDADHYVMAHTGDTTTEAVYNGWYSAVYVPASTPPTPAVEIDTHAVTVEKDETVTLTATTTPAGETITWSSSDDNTASVTSGGVVEGVAVGSAIITATITKDGVNYTDTCTVIVTNTAVG